MPSKITVCSPKIQLNIFVVKIKTATTTRRRQAVPFFESSPYTQFFFFFSIHTCCWSSSSSSSSDSYTHIFFQVEDFLFMNNRKKMCSGIREEEQDTHNIEKENPKGALFMASTAGQFLFLLFYAFFNDDDFIFHIYSLCCFSSKNIFNIFFFYILFLHLFLLYNNFIYAGLPCW